MGTKEQWQQPNGKTNNIIKKGKNRKVIIWGDEVDVGRTDNSSRTEKVEIPVILSRVVVMLCNQCGQEDDGKEMTRWTYEYEESNE